MDAKTANDTIEAAITEFSGGHLRALRKHIREVIANGGDVRALAKGKAFTALGIAKLEAVAKAVEASK